MKVVVANCLVLLMAGVPSIPVFAGGYKQSYEDRHTSNGWTTEKIAAIFRQLDDNSESNSKHIATFDSGRVRHVVKHKRKRHYSGRNKSTLRRIARSMAVRHLPGIDPRFYESIISWESNFEPLRGPSGEVGYAQILPATARPYFLTGQLKGSLWQAETNLKAGVLYLADLKKLIGHQETKYMRRHRIEKMHLLLAGYNGGWGAVRDAVKKDKPFPPHLQLYIRNVCRIYRNLNKEQD